MVVEVLSVIEATSFVSPKWVPQLADAEEVLAGLALEKDTRYPVLVPNLHGLDRAIDAGAREIAVFTAASESFCQRNTNCSMAESMERMRGVVAAAAAKGLRSRGMKGLWISHHERRIRNFHHWWEKYMASEQARE